MSSINAMRLQRLVWLLLAFLAALFACTIANDAHASSNQFDEFAEEDEDGAFMQMGVSPGRPSPGKQQTGKAEEGQQVSAKSNDETSSLLQRPQLETALGAGDNFQSAPVPKHAIRITGKRSTGQGNVVDSSAQQTPTAEASGGVQKTAQQTQKAIEMPSISHPISQPHANPVAPTASAEVLEHREIVPAQTDLQSSLALRVFQVALVFAACAVTLFTWRWRAAKPNLNDMADDDTAHVLAAHPEQFEIDTDTEGLPTGNAKGLPVHIQAPQPTPRLSCVGTSFVVPLTRISTCSKSTLSIDVPVSPAVWPLKATFCRSGQHWGKIELTVDIIDAAGLPPLLCCGAPHVFAPLQDGAGSGGTGAPDDEETVCPAFDGDNEAFLELRSGAGVLAGHVLPKIDGGYTVRREGHPTLDIEAHLTESEYWIVVYKRGQEVGIATRLAHGKFSAKGGDEYIQIDTQPDTSSPESMLLLMCMLAIMVFEPSRGAKE